MGPAIVAGISAIGGFFSNYFKTKQQGIAALSGGAQAVIQLLNNTQMSEAERERAISEVIAAEAQSESWLTRSWRPLVAIILWGMVFAMFMGYNPAAFDAEMTDTKMWVLETARWCLFGYMPIRSVDKWVSEFMRSKALTAVINKYLK